MRRVLMVVMTALVITLGLGQRLAAATPATDDVEHAATTASALPVGAQFHGTWTNMSDDTRAKTLDALVDAGVTWVRVDIGWSTLQPKSAGSYDVNWYGPTVDKAVNMAHDRGLKVLATFWRTPDRANASAGLVMLGGPMYVDTDWISSLYAAGARDYFDVMAVQLDLNAKPALIALKCQLRNICPAS